MSKINKTVREAFEDAFAHLQESPTANLKAWGVKNPDKFYMLSHKLIPTQIAATVNDVTELTPAMREARLASLLAKIEQRVAGEDEEPQSFDDLA